MSVAISAVELALAGRTAILALLSRRWPEALLDPSVLEESPSAPLFVALVRRCLHPRLVERQLEVVRADPIALRVRVRERPALEQLVVQQVHAIDEDACAEGGLLDLGEVVRRVAVERDAPIGRSGDFSGARSSSRRADRRRAPGARRLP
ncbi:hypothetical protein WMF26_01875 [Sorangium sp. So ce185]